MENIINSLKAYANEININEATIKECMVANILYLGKLDDETIYKAEKDFCKNNPFKESKQLEVGDVISIINSYNMILFKRKEWYLKNTWGINVEELSKKITNFENDFKDFIKGKEKDVINSLHLYKPREIKLEDNSSIYPENDHRSILYNLGKCEYFLNDNTPFTKSFKLFIKQYEDLKYMIHDAATIKSDEYIAELRTYTNYLLNYDVEFSEYIKFTMLISKINSHHTKAQELHKSLSKPIESQVNYSFPIRNNYINIFSEIKDESKEMLTFYANLCKGSKNNIYNFYHLLLSNYNIKENHQKRSVGRLLYHGYIKWCKRQNITPHITIESNFLIEYPINSVNTHGYLYHFPKKRFIDHSNNVKREKLNKTFLKNLLKGMIDEKIIASDTKEEHFFFVFGWGEDNIKDFKAIEILKPNTNYIRENGKRTIIFLLTRLMKYREDEDIKPKFLYRKRHLILIINSCFKASTKFKSSDFGEKTTFEGSEILKMQNIYNTALNATKETIQ